MTAVRVIPPYVRDRVIVSAEGAYNVKYPQFGAKGDGVTDDTAAIQEAIDACYDAGGGAVFFPPSPLGYAVDPATRITLRTGVSLLGSGSSGPIVRYGTFDKTAPSQRFLRAVLPTTDVHVENLHFDGRLDDIPIATDQSNGIQSIGGLNYLNGAQDLSGDVVLYDATIFPASGSFSCDGQTVTYTSKTATTLQGCNGTAGLVIDTHSRVNRVFSFTVDSTSGFPAAGSFLVQATDNEDYAITYTSLNATTFSGCVGGLNPSTISVADDTVVYELLEGVFMACIGITPLDPGETHENIVIRDCTFRDIPGVGVYYSSVDQGLIESNIFDGCDRGGIGLPGGCNHVEIINNIIFSQDDGIAVYSAFDVDAPSKNILIQGNIIDNEAGPGQRGSNNSIHLGTVQDSLVVDNWCFKPGEGINVNKSCVAIHPSAGWTPRRVTIARNYCIDSNDYGIAISDFSQRALLNGAQDLSGTITVKGFTGDETNPEPTEVFEESGFITVNGNVVSYTGKTDTTFTGCTGTANVQADLSIVFIGMEDIKILDNVIKGSTDEGIRCTASVINGEIRRNTIRNAGGNGINLATTGFYDNLAVTDNNLHDIDGRAIFANTAGNWRGLTIARNKIRNSVTGGGAAVDAIHIGAVTSNNNFAIVGNEISTDTDLYANKPRYAVHVATGDTGIVKDNRCSLAHVGTRVHNILSTNTNTETTTAAAAMPVPNSDWVLVTGNTNITSIAAGGYPGQVVTYQFSGTPTFTDGNNLKIAGNLVATADDTITLRCDGTNWFEISRAVN